MENTVDTP